MPGGELLVRKNLTQKQLPAHAGKMPTSLGALSITPSRSQISCIESAASVLSRITANEHHAQFQVTGYVFVF